MGPRRLKSRGVALRIGGITLAAICAAPSARADGGPKVSVPVTSMDLGALKEGVVAPLSFELDNVGDEDLIIVDARGDCGCTVVHLASDERVIPPGGSLTLRAEFDTRGRAQPGIQRKAIHVTTNDPARRDVKLEFTAQVVSLFRRLPTGNLRLHRVRRGTAASTVLELLAGSIGLEPTVTDITLDPPVPLTPSVAPFSERGRSGQRVTFTVNDDAPLGTLHTKVRLSLKVGEDDLHEVIDLLAEVVGDLQFRPYVVDTTRKKSLRGQKLIPVSVDSTSHQPFKILAADAGRILTATVGPGRVRDGSAYVVELKVRDDAPVGPFGALLRIRTDSLDQPLIEIPVFGTVAPPVGVEPAMVMLVAGGGDVGTRRRVKFQATRPANALGLADPSIDLPYVEVRIDTNPRLPYPHIAYVIVSITGDVPPGTHEATLSVTTAVPGSEHMEVPVTVVGPDEP